MKELHLICNAHLDPVWQWDWNEGATAALATFYAAVDIAEEYDYIFCHNEALLYEYIEKYDPELFARIQDMVKKGKWHIMGGWYVQPDCTVPSGEGFVRQIESGLTYFKEKFGVRPTVAVNFDSFGHTQGLVQILNKCGYEGYIFCRPLKMMVELPDNLFKWVGLDGSTVKACRFEDDTIYCSGLGTAVNDIKRKMRPWGDRDVAFALWGIGNHGGGPSRKDLTEIKEFAEESKKDGVAIIHSTPEAFFSRVEPAVEINKALEPCFVKCYSSDSILKHKYAELENKLIVTEKICAYAASEGKLTYDHAAFAEAQKNMSAMQFHDVLSGTSVVDGEQSSLRKADYAMEILDKQFTKAFFNLFRDYEKAAPGDYPVFMYNPLPYKIEGAFECEIFLLDPIVSDTEAYDFKIIKDGEECPYQIVKEGSSINMDRRKRFAIKTELNPMSLTRFDIKISKKEKVLLDRTPQSEFDLGRGVTAKFDTDSGCLSSFVVDGKEYLCGGAFAPVMFEDNADPWGWWLKTVGTNYKYADNKISLRVIERGDLLTTVESIYDTGKSEIRVAYKLYKDYDYVDVTVNVCWNDPGKGLKLEIPVTDAQRFIGQTSFGIQEYEHGLEQCSHRFCGVGADGEVFTVFKDGTYGCSVENGKMYITLLNGSVYCAHPVGELPIIDEERFNYYLDTGRHEFSFRIGVCNEEELERRATEFIQKPYALNAYPHGKGEKQENSPVTVSDNNVVVTSFRMVSPDCYMLRLINNYKEAAECVCSVFGQSINLSFGKYEVKTLIYANGELKESDSMLEL